MKKEIPAILLESARKYHIEISDVDDRIAFLSLHSALQHDVDVTQAHLLALSSLSRGTEWEKPLHDQMINHITNPNVLKEDGNLGSDPYSQLFSDVPFLSSLSLASPIAALAIIKEPALSNLISEKLSDKVLADLYCKICSDYPEIAMSIFFTERNNFITKLISVIQDRDDSPERLARIFSRGMETNSEFWEKQFAYGNVVRGWIDKILKQGNPDRQLEVLAESEKAFTNVLRSTLLPNYGRSYFPISGLVIMTLCKKWPLTARYVVASFPKDATHVAYIKELVPCLIQAAKEQDLFSIEAYAMLAATGLAAPDVPQDFQKVEELCGQLMKAGDLDAVNRVARTLAKGVAGTFVGTSKETLMKCDKRVGLAYHLFQAILADTNTDENNKAKNLTKHDMEDPLFRFELAEHYQCTGRFESAIVLYSDILERTEKSIKKIRKRISDVSISSFQAHTRESIFTNLKEQRKAIENIGPEALHRLGMVWTERLQFLNNHPHSDPQCIFNLAGHYFAKGNLDLSCRLLLTATRFDSKFRDNELCYDLAVKFISVGKFDKAVTLLALIPEGKNYVRAQNMLTFGGHPEETLKNESSILEEGNEPLLSKADILDFALPFYRKAKEAGHEEAAYMVKQLEAEHESLTHPDQKLSTWKY